MDKITEEIYVGGQTTPQNIKAHGIKSVINLSSVPAEYPAEGMPISDSGENDPKRFIEILKKIDSNIKSGRTPVYVSCLAGMSRSVVVTALYLVYKKRFSSIDEAVEFVMVKHPHAMPSLELIDFVKEKVIPLL